MGIKIKGMILGAFEHAGLIAEGQTEITDGQRATGFKLMQHLIRTSFHTHTLAFAKGRILVDISSGTGTIPDKYCHLTNCIYVYPRGEYGAAMKRATEDQILMAMSTKYEQGTPECFAVDYDRRGKLSLSFDPKPTEGSVMCTVYERIDAPKTIEDELDMPDEWETPIEFGLAVILAGEYGQSVTKETASMAKASWKQVSMMHANVGAVSR